MADEKTPLLKSGENGQPQPKVAFAPSEEYVLNSGGNSVSEVGGQSFTNFRQHYIALLGLRLHIALRKLL